MHEYVTNKIWLKDYPVHYSGITFNARMTIVRLHDDSLLLHSPCEIDLALKTTIEALGKVNYIVAPGTYHYLHVPSAQQAFPKAKTLICPGIEKKQPNLHYDSLLSDTPEPDLQTDFKQVLIQGAGGMNEVAFYHIPSQTLVLVDLIEYITDKTPDIGWGIKFWWKLIFRMWNKPKPAPEYQLGWKDKSAAAKSLQHILTWNFQRIVIAHGDLINSDAQQMATQAWSSVLKHEKHL
tara:strand:- start:138209 stop:138916 length:708 start_codon:yes stop_codon:yes gene_type:complete